MAASTLQAPSERVFGRESVGRHHDPFTLMQQIDRPFRLGPYSQPVTDLTGAALAWISGPVAAYNWLILISFPLSAAAAFLLARHLSLSRAGAAVAAMAFAFSPFHLAHAAYHPHVAQTQWLALYLLALWRCLDASSTAAIAWLGAATVAVTLSNFYGGLIAAVITPVAILAYVAASRRGESGAQTAVFVTASTLAAFAAAGLAYVAFVARLPFGSASGYEARASDLVAYSATWSSYLIPPVAHPLFGDRVRAYWLSEGVRDGLLEQQVSLGWGIVALAMVAIAAWVSRRHDRAKMAAVPTLLAVAAMAFVCSLSPQGSIGAFTFARPSALLYEIAPMFRSYARFGLVVQLMAAVLAGIGVDRLLRSGTAGGRIVCGALLALACFEYANSPLLQSRDVLPSAAHRWIMNQGPALRVLDCAQDRPDSASVSWLTSGRISMLGGMIDDCREPALAAKLAAHGYTHLLVRRGAANAPWQVGAASQLGLRVAATFNDSRVFSIAGPPPLVYTEAMTGFFAREDDPDWSWRWMSTTASWTVVNRTSGPLNATLDLEASSFHDTRDVTLLFDGRLVQTMNVAPARRSHRIGPLTVLPGSHILKFSPIEPPKVADDIMQNRDRRPLSIAIGAWTWAVEGVSP
jgi:hypothetical protein